MPTKFTTTELGWGLAAGLSLVLAGTFLVFGPVVCGIEAILIGSLLIYTIMRLRREQG